MSTPTIISQGSVSTGRAALHENENALFTEAFYLREAILAAPDGMSESESQQYFENMIQHMVSCPLALLYQ